MQVLHAGTTTEAGRMNCTSVCVSSLLSYALRGRRERGGGDLKSAVSDHGVGVQLDADTPPLRLAPMSDREHDAIDLIRAANGRDNFKVCTISRFPSAAIVHPPMVPTERVMEKVEMYASMGDTSVVSNWGGGGQKPMLILPLQG